MPELLTHLPQEVVPVRHRPPMRATRIVVAGGFAVFALLHIAPGMHAMVRQPWWLLGTGPAPFAALCVAALVLAVSIAGLFGAACGLLRVKGLRNHWFSLAVTIFGMLVFEPAHFIMQRKMMLEIKRLSERAARKGAQFTLAV
jgi:hypothetical protein